MFATNEPWQFQPCTPMEWFQIDALNKLLNSWFPYFQFLQHNSKSVYRRYPYRVGKHWKMQTLTNTVHMHQGDCSYNLLKDLYIAVSNGCPICHQMLSKNQWSLKEFKNPLANMSPAVRLLYNLYAYNTFMNVIWLCSFIIVFFFFY